MLNLAKRVTADGEGASKFISISVENAKNENDAKKIAFSIANSPLVKTAIAGEDAVRPPGARAARCIDRDSSAGRKERL